EPGVVRDLARSHRRGRPGLRSQRLSPTPFTMKRSRPTDSAGDPDAPSRSVSRRAAWRDDARPAPRFASVRASARRAPAGTERPRVAVWRARGSDPAAAVAALGGVPAEAADRAARLLWIGIVALALGRALSTYATSMWLWGFNPRRFSDVGMGWLSW